MSWEHANTPEAVANRKTKKEGAKLLSAGYREWLGRLVPTDIREAYKLPEGATWADYIAIHTIKRAVGLVSKDNICFTAITELRETTEGKTAEKIVATGNAELAALAFAINGQPAPVEG